MTFCNLLYIYLTLFEGPYALYYEQLFRVSHPMTVDNGAIFRSIYYLHFHPQCLDFFFYFYVISKWNINRSRVNVEAVDTCAMLIYCV